MPNGSAFEDAVSLVRDNMSRTNVAALGVGIHLSLVGERCVAPAADLRAMVTADGLLPDSYSAFTKLYLTKRIGAGEVRTEILAQIDRVLAAGITPTHIDSHQHLHMLPGVFEIVLDTAIDSGIPVIRVPLERDGPGPRGLSARTIQTWILYRISLKKLRQVRDAGLKTADWFWGLGVSGQMNEANLTETLNRLQPGVNEIMCHPGISDPETTEHYAWGYSWDDELAALKSDSVRSFIEENDVRLASFADAWATGQS
jgi:predicted glycoside hydrolase/deacetylase ChbG (UPF0249 family)